LPVERLTRAEQTPGGSGENITAATAQTQWRTR
jgi:hypothetical protein